MQITNTNIDEHLCERVWDFAPGVKFWIWWRIVGCLLWGWPWSLCCGARRLWSLDGEQNRWWREGEGGGHLYSFLSGERSQTLVCTPELWRQPARPGQLWIFILIIQADKWLSRVIIIFTSYNFIFLEAGQQTLNTWVIKWTQQEGLWFINSWCLSTTQNTRDLLVVSQAVTLMSCPVDFRTVPWLNPTTAAEALWQTFQTVEWIWTSDTF